MAALARFALSVSWSLISASFLWGCGSSSSNNSPDAAATSAKLDSTVGTSSDLPVVTTYDSSPVIDSSAARDSSHPGIDAFLSVDVGALDVGSGTSNDLALNDRPSRDLPSADAPLSNDLPSSGSADSSGAPDSPGGHDAPTVPGTGGSAGSGGGSGGAGGTGGTTGTSTNTGGTTAAPVRLCGAKTDAPETPNLIVPSGTYQGIVTIAADSTSIYWPQYNGVMKVAKTGGTPVTLFSVPTDQTYYVYGLAVDDTSVYFVLSGCCATGGGESWIKKVSKNANTDDAGSPGPSDDFYYQWGGGGLAGGGQGQLALDDTNVYRAGAAGLFAIPKTGGAPTSLFDTTGAGPTDSALGMAIGFPGINSLAVDGSWVCYLVGQTYGGAIASNSPLAYSGWLLEAPLQGGNPTIIASKAYVPAYQTGVAVAGGFAYWLNGSVLYKQSLSNPSNAPTVIASGFPGGGATPVSDGKNVYFLAEGDLCKVPVDGGDAVGLLYGNWTEGNSGSYPDLIVDDTNVYAIYASEQGILAIPK